MIWFVIVTSVAWSGAGDVCYVDRCEKSRLAGLVGLVREAR